jgi:hypothetical protein
LPCLRRAYYTLCCLLPVGPDRALRPQSRLGRPAALPGYATERSAHRRRIDTAHPLRMEAVAVPCPLVPGVPPLLSGSCASPRAFGWGFLQTPPHGGRPCPSPHLRLREDLARGRAPRSFCAMPGTHGRHELRGSPRRLHALVRRSASPCHRSLAEFVHTLLDPELSLPTRIVERLTQHQCDKPLGLHGTQGLHQGTEAAYA